MFIEQVEVLPSPFLMNTVGISGIMRNDFHPDLVTFKSSPPYTDHSVYKEETVIGNGAYGTVYKAKDINHPGDYVALKKVRIPMSNDGVPVSILREISMVRQLQKFDHPNIVRFLDVCHAPMENESSLLVFLVFEYVEMDLAKYIHLTPNHMLDEFRIKDILFQILCGVDFLHGQRIVHRDLKPQNILVSKTGKIKLADFGLSKIYEFSMKLTSVVVTLWYRSPEVLLGGTYGSSIDLWSIGCIMAELYRRRALFPGESEKDQLEKIFDVLGKKIHEDEWPHGSRILPHSFRPRPKRELETVVPGIDEEGLNLLSQMLLFSPENRISADNALSHVYFNGRVVPASALEHSLSMEQEEKSIRVISSSSPKYEESSDSFTTSLNVSTSPDDSGYSSTPHNS